MDSGVATTSKGPLTWYRYRVTRLELSHVSALLVLQGLPLKKFFESASFSDSNLPVGDTYDFLAGALTPLTEPPLRLLGLCLARTPHTPTGLSNEERLGVLLRSLVSPG